MQATTDLVSVMPPRDHGGGIDAAVARWGGTRADWLDLSTGINPVPYPLPAFTPADWNDLPDQAAQNALLKAARDFWQVPDGAEIIVAPGASALIARIPALKAAGTVDIPAPTYNEHAAAFEAQGWTVGDHTPDACVLVHPNNPTGKLWQAKDIDAPLVVIDESFSDICPEQSLVRLTDQPGRIVLKSFGKFWGLAGMRLGFAIAMPDTIAKLTALTGPWAVSGPALRTGAAALRDHAWAEETRGRLQADSDRLDALLTAKGARVVGGTTLFRLYDVPSATTWQEGLAQHHIWSRIFPYSETYLRLGLPAPDRWDQLEHALEAIA